MTQVVIKATMIRKIDHWQLHTVIFIILLGDPFRLSMLQSRKYHQFALDRLLLFEAIKRMKAAFLLVAVALTFPLPFSLPLGLEVCLIPIVTTAIVAPQTDPIEHLRLVLLILLLNYLDFTLFFCFLGESRAKRARRFRKGDLKLRRELLKKLLAIFILPKQTILTSPLLKSVKRSESRTALKPDLFFRQRRRQAIAELGLLQRRRTLSMRVRGINKVKINRRRGYRRVHYLSNIIINGKPIPETRWGRYSNSWWYQMGPFGMGCGREDGREGWVLNISFSNKLIYFQPLMASVEVSKLSSQEVAELACTYAALILHDDEQDITGDKIGKLVQASGVKVEPYWPKIFAKALEGKDISSFFNFGGSAGSAAPAAEAAPVAQKDAKKEVKKEAPPPPKEEEEEMDMGDLFG